MKKKVIDIHFNLQFITCHPIFMPKTRKQLQSSAQAMRVDSGEQRKEETMKQRRRRIFPDQMTYSEKLQETKEIRDYLGFEAECRR